MARSSVSCCSAGAALALAIALVWPSLACSTPTTSSSDPTTPTRRERPVPDHSDVHSDVHGDVHSDVHSHARPDEARVTHIALDLRPDFATRSIAGIATLSIVRKPEARVVVLDQRGLVIESITGDDGAPLAFALGPDHPLMGPSLTVTLPSPAGSTTTKVTIRYRTGPEAQALQWLTPAQTASKKQPFLFTQGQAILTRTWLPLQDSPGLRITYEARVHVPKGMRAVMSAEPLSPVGTVSGDDAAGEVVFDFKMPQPIPGYLIALAIGDLAFRALGPRTGVYADPTVVDAAAFEFADTENMVAAAEALYGPYRWGRYDILVLPPSFPFGGMENPRLTFASPTVIAGDRSLVSLIAHELAHSWSGNLVTNATWSDIWLNEGTTVYFEDRIIEALYGTDRAQMNQLLDWQNLTRELAEFGSGTDQGRGAKESKLWRVLDVDEDPDDAISGVPYVKGSAFLRHIEGVVGRARFDEFLMGYFNAHAFSSMTTARFLALVTSDLAQSDAERQAMHLDEWAYGTDLPGFAVPPTSTLLQQVDADVARLAAGAAPSSIDTSRYSALSWVHLLKNLPRAQTPAQMAALDDAWGLNASGLKGGNNEVLFEWLRLVIDNHDARSLPLLERYLTRQGRRKLVLPLYEQLLATSWGRPFAERVFAAARPTYHPLTVASVEAALAAPAKPTTPTTTPTTPTTPTKTNTEATTTP